MIRVGTCGFAAARNKIYSALDAVELQETFYDMPTKERMKKLREEAPEGFSFSVKVFQGLTHDPSMPTFKKAKRFRGEGSFGLLRPTKENMKIWDEFYEATSLLTPVMYVFQSPPSFGSREQIEQAIEFFSTIRKKGVTIGWEPRGVAYNNIDLLDRLFTKTGIVHIVDPFRRLPMSADPVYFRLHGIGNKETNYRYNYTDQDLLRLLSVTKNAALAYVMFNNVYMFENATSFKRLVEGSQ